MPEPRKCKACGQTYPATRAFFWRVKDNRLGLDTTCKYCRNDGKRQHYAEDEGVRARQRANFQRWYARPKNKQHVVEASTAWRQANPARSRTICNRAAKRYCLRRTLRAKGLKAE